MSTEEKVIKLKFPIDIPKKDGGNIKVDSIRLGRLKAKHLRHLPDSMFEGDGEVKPVEMIPLISALANIPIECVDEMDLEDLIEIAGELGNFLSTSLSTGEK